VLPRIFIETLFVIALINRRDQYHQQALDLAAQFEGHPLLVTDAVLLEIGNALARSYKQEAVEIIEQFLAAEEVEVVHLTPHLFAQGFVLYKSHEDKAWGGIILGAPGSSPAPEATLERGAPSKGSDTTGLEEVH
jgi:predicted nucleic acid-binding protein